MSSIILNKHSECVIVKASKEGCYLMSNNNTGWVAGLSVDNEGAYRIDILDGAYDTKTLKHFVEFLKARGLQPEKYLA